MSEKDISGPAYYKRLAQKLLNGTITEEEYRELESWYNSGQDEPVHIPLSFVSGESEHEQRLLKKIAEKAGLKTRTLTIGSYLTRKTWWAAAAVLLIALTSGIYFFNQYNKADSGMLTATDEIQNDILPGGNKAVLTLADGSRILLDSISNGAITTQGNTTVFKLADGELSYSGESGLGEAAVTYNTISTPRGGQYQLTLQDGTKVWLNAESSLRFPTTFRSNERTVALEGEGYFEVVSNEKQPFFVHVGNMEVKVTGTHFNVKAYTDEPEIQTTLLQGKVAVRNGSSEVMLLPGQQARLNISDARLTTKNEVDLTRVLAWKNDEFVFDDTEIKEVMRTLSRWYDFDAVYNESVQQAYLYGSISREKSLSSVLKMMEELGIQFKIEKAGGKNKVIVY